MAAMFSLHLLVVLMLWLINVYLVNQDGVYMESGRFWFNLLFNLKCFHNRPYNCIAFRIAFFFLYV